MAAARIVWRCGLSVNTGEVNFHGNGSVVGTHKEMVEKGIEIAVRGFATLKPANV